MPEKKRGRPVGSSSKSPRSRKTESLTIRLDERTRFMLDFVARHRDESITRVIERSVERFAGDPANVSGLNDLLSWIDYWHPSADVRVVKGLILGLPRMTAEEEELKDFLLYHQVFFCEWHEEYGVDEEELHELSVAFHIDWIEALWPNIEEYLAQWKESRSEEPDAVGTMMKARLDARGFDAPAWPPTAAQRRRRQDKVTYL